MRHGSPRHESCLTSDPAGRISLRLFKPCVPFPAPPSSLSLLPPSARRGGRSLAPSGALCSRGCFAVGTWTLPSLSRTSPCRRRQYVYCCHICRRHSCPLGTHRVATLGTSVHMLVACQSVPVANLSTVRTSCGRCNRLYHCQVPHFHRFVVVGTDETFQGRPAGPSHCPPARTRGPLPVQGKSTSIPDMACADACRVLSSIHDGWGCVR